MTLEREIEERECEHLKCQPEFDAEKANAMSADEVKAAYPRFDGKCPDCGQMVIVYASFRHYISGDW